jgi:dihydroorotase
MRLLIKNADVVFPTGIRAANIVAENGRIVDVDASAATTADDVVDARGLHLIPGVVDDQVHFREPGLTHKEDLTTASRACAKGGVTSYLEMPNTKPATITHQELEAKLARAAEVSRVNYGFYIGATPNNVDVLRSVRRTPGIKIFIGSSTGDLLVDQQEALERIFAETTLPICAHCEDEATVQANTARLGPNLTIHDHSRIRDHAAAIISTRRAVALAEKYHHHFHVLHVSTADEVEFLRETKPRHVSAEVCPHHLYFCIDDYDRLGSLVQMNPSIKTAHDNEVLWQALAEGTIQVVATDHAPHTLEEKAKPYPASPSGLPAVENSLALMLDAVNRGRLTLERLVDAMCAAPARIWQMRHKGVIAEGYDADLVLVDMNLRQTIRNGDQVTKCGWSPWDGVELQGWPVCTWVRGRKVWERGRFDDSVRGAEITYREE